MDQAQLLKRQAADAKSASIISGLVLGYGVGDALILAAHGLAQELAHGELADLAAIPVSMLASVAAEATRIHLRARACKIGFVRSVQIELAQKETVRDLSWRMGLGRPRKQEVRCQNSAR